jgi:hypothetical protein
MKIILFTLLLLPVHLLAQCSDCEKIPPENPHQLERAKTMCDKYLADITNTKLDHPENQTTDRGNFLFSLPAPLSKRARTLRNCRKDIFITLIKTDPYPEMRTQSAAQLASEEYEGKEVCESLKNALNDENVTVRIFAAISLQIRRNRDPFYSRIWDTLVEKRLKDAALGINSDNWNVNGFYQKTISTRTNDSLSLIAKTDIQYWAVNGLKHLIGKPETLEVLKTLELNNRNPVFRANAKKIIEELLL